MLGLIRITIWDEITRRDIFLKFSPVLQALGAM
jgi:hypothetical protein